MRISEIFNFCFIEFRQSVFWFVLMLSVDNSRSLFWPSAKRRRFSLSRHTSLSPFLSNSVWAADSRKRKVNDASQNKHSFFFRARERTELKRDFYGFAMNKFVSLQWSRSWNRVYMWGKCGAARKRKKKEKRWEFSPLTTYRHRPTTSIYFLLHNLQYKVKLIIEHTMRSESSPAEIQRLSKKEN